MIKSIIYFVVSIVCLGVLDYLIPAITISSSWIGVLIFLLVLAIINYYILPIFKFLTLPLNILTLGLVSFIINMIGLYIAVEFTRAIGINASGINYFFNLILISITLSIAQNIVNNVTPSK